MENLVTYKVVQNKIFKDFRVVKYVNNIWHNERDNNWSEEEAKIKLLEYQNLTNNSILTMSDNI